MSTQRVQPGGCFDVVICGGGLAGLALARQLLLREPALHVAVVEQSQRPLREAAHKVGESSVEVGTHYFGKVLELEDYFDSRQLPKLGLRYFMGNSQGPFCERPELGPSLFPPAPSYQIDRGRLENDLRGFLEVMGAQLFEGYIVKDIVLANDTARHEVVVQSKSSQQSQALPCRWVVDATSRRRILQNKLNLKEANGHKASAAWWRFAGRLDVDDLVPGSNRKWHRRVVESRYLSTNHIMGRGYWVWLIPLATNNTSVGIVTDEEIHPFKSYGRSYGQALNWLAEHEPALRTLIGDREPLDFRGLKDYSYHSKQVFSAERWSCVGEAGVFLDPFYSPGSDFIAVGNTITANMIALDRQGELTPAIVDTYNRCYLALSRSGAAVYRKTYATFGHCHIFTAKHLWDAASYWSFWAQLFFQHILECPDRLAEIFPLVDRYGQLVEKMQQLFVDWSERVPPTNTYEFMDLSSKPLLQMLHLDLLTRRTPDEFYQTSRENLDRLEELAQVLFWQAVKECLPEEQSLVHQRPWINAWRIGLNPAVWEEDGLFVPDTQPRDLRSAESNIHGIFEPLGRIERAKLAAAGQAMSVGRGKPFYALTDWYVRRFIEGKSGLATRRRLFRKLFAPGDSRPSESRDEVKPMPSKN